MPTENLPQVKCPICLHAPCEVLEVGSEPDLRVPGVHQQVRPKKHVRCPQCGAEFHVTDMK